MLKKKIGNSDPRKQQLALTLTQSCCMHCGIEFHKQVRNHRVRSPHKAPLRWSCPQLICPISIIPFHISQSFPHLPFTSIPQFTPLPPLIPPQMVDQGVLGKMIKVLDRKNTAAPIKDEIKGLVREWGESLSPGSPGCPERPEFAMAYHSLLDRGILFPPTPAHATT